MNQQPLNYYYAKTGNNVTEARMSNPYMNIQFECLGSPGVSIRTVLEGLTNFTEYRQGTRQGSDADAKVLAKLHEALDILKGTKTIGSVESMLGSQDKKGT